MKPVYAYESMKYGFFVHYIACEALYKDGTKAQTLDEAVDGFDVPGFAESLAQMKIEYLIFTAWHFRVLPLYPSAVTAKWRPGCEVKRDLLGEMIDAVRAKGIKIILYTHPRDGHDFVGEERVNTGWGEGHCEGKLDTPNPETFDVDKWNRYMLEMYEELLQRYGSRIDGIYTDGMGPGVFDENGSNSYEKPIIDYLKIRQLVKKTNPDLSITQNGFGWQFSDDFVMPEAYFGFEWKYPDITGWPACDKALALTPFGSWAASGKYGEEIVRVSAEDIARFTAFQASCASGGGTCWASGPYCGGGWDAGVVETMAKAGGYLAKMGEGVKDVVQSTSWPTVSGDTLKSRGYVFACSSKDRAYEYVHVVRWPEDGVVRLPAAADGAKIAYPRAMCAGAKVSEFVQDESGVSFRLDGKADDVDTIIRFRRVNNVSADKWMWINDSDKRFRYSSKGWRYEAVCAYDGVPEKVDNIGCYEYDVHTSRQAGARVDTWFEGSVVEVYGVLDPAGGRMDILIDDMLVGTADTNARERQVRKLLLVTPDLCGGIHTLSIIAKDDKPVAFDAVRIRE